MWLEGWWKLAVALAGIFHTTTTVSEVGRHLMFKFSPSLTSSSSSTIDRVRPTVHIHIYTFAGIKRTHHTVLDLQIERHFRQNICIPVGSVTVVTAIGLSGPAPTAVYALTDIL